MSITHMARVWELDLGPMETLVALALADHADEPGRCWPSIARLVRMTGMGERTVQRVLRTLEADGYLRRVDRPGNSSEFFLTLNKGVQERHPRQSGTPSERHPRQADTPSERRGRGAGAAPKPSENHHRDVEANASPSSAREKSRPKKDDPFPRPDGVDPQVWSDFLKNRSRKALANTATAHKRMMDDLNRFSDDEWPIPRLIEFATARGWGGIYDPRKEDHGRSSFNPEPTGVGPTELAARNILKRRVAAEG